MHPVAFEVFMQEYYDAYRKTLPYDVNNSGIRHFYQDVIILRSFDLNEREIEIF